MRVSTADFIKHYGTLADKALSEPVTITKNGRERLVVVSAEEYARLRRRERRAVTASELTDREIALIAAAEVPPEYAHLDEDGPPAFFRVVRGRFLASGRKEKAALVKRTE